MEIYFDQTHWYDRVWAAFIFFTRLPLWKMHQPPKECYKAVVEFWPLVGWMTGGVMSAIIYFGSLILPYSVAILMAIIARIMLTGALHEDGLCDFLDGFGGGGNDRERILAIMKDSHTGTFGVLGITLYCGLLFASLYSLPPFYASLAVFAGDAYSKMLAAQIIMFLPYARSEVTAKSHIVYRKMSIPAGIALFIQGMLPLIPLLYIGSTNQLLRWDLIVFIPCLTMYFLYYMMLRKLHGYTGDCCGALFLLVELSFYLTVTSQM